MRKHLKTSLNQRMIMISLTVFMPMLFVMIYLLVSLSNATDAYSEITHNIVYANQYTQDFKGRIDYSMYMAVINQKSVDELGDGEMLINISTRWSVRATGCLSGRQWLQAATVSGA